MSPSPEAYCQQLARREFLHSWQTGKRPAQRRIWLNLAVREARAYCFLLPAGPERTRKLAQARRQHRQLKAEWIAVEERYLSQLQKLKHQSAESPRGGKRR